MTDAQDLLSIHRETNNCNRLCDVSDAGAHLPAMHRATQHHLCPPVHHAPPLWYSGVVN